ncbi:hypothetical protein FDZ74_10755, partial [bacterium]
MQTKAVLSALQKYCDAKNLPDTLAALRHDPLVWNVLPQFDFDRYAQWQIEKHSAGPWTPASLALFALETELTVEALGREPLMVLDGNLQRRALAVFEETLRTGRAPADLREAGLLALALRERRRKMRSWAGMNDDLTLKGDLAAERVEEIWRSALACLYTIIPDRGELLKALLQDHSLRGMGWCIHIVLSNPADETEQAKLLTGLMLDAPLETQAAWLGGLQSVGREGLAEKIARMLLAANQSVFDALKRQSNPAQTETKNVLEQAARLQHAAVIFRCAGASLQSAGLLEKAQQLLAYCLASVQIQHAGLSVGDNKLDVAAASVEKALRISQEPILIERGISVLHETGLLDVDVPLADRQPGFLSALYLARQMAAKGSFDLAGQTASRAVEEWLSQQSYAGLLHETEDAPLQTVTTLMRFNLIKDAARCTE